MTRVGTGLSTFANTEDAVRDASTVARDAIGGAVPDLAFLFLTPEHLGDTEEAVREARRVLQARHLLGCVAQGVIAGAREVERGPAASVWAASLPGAAITPFHLEADADDGDLRLRGLPDVDDAALIAMIVEPYAFPADAVLEAIDARYPGVGVVGGVALGGGRPDAQALVVDGEIRERGAVGVVLANVAVRAVVSQGCAAVGREAVVTRAERNVMLELAGEPALERLQHEIESFTDRERALASRGGVLTGIVIDENKPEYGRGDFLMRPIVGADRDTGALAIGDHVRVGQTVRFHVRDATTAHDDLELALGEAVAVTGPAAAGALLFSCNGRGSAMFDEPDHDARAVVGALGHGGVGGFFCGGEIGPVGGRSFLHGFTATLAVFLEQ
jgi:small ligand-binding sensory domain FIST